MSRVKKNICPHCKESLDKEPSRKPIQYMRFLGKGDGARRPGEYRIGGRILDVKAIAANGKVISGELNVFIDESKAFEGMAVIFNDKGFLLVKDESKYPKSMLNVMHQAIAGVKRKFYHNVCMVGNIHSFQHVKIILSGEQRIQKVYGKEDKEIDVSIEKLMLGKITNGYSFQIRWPTSKELEAVPGTIVTLCFSHIKVPLSIDMENIFRSMTNDAWYNLGNVGKKFVR